MAEQWVAEQWVAETAKWVAEPAAAEWGELVVEQVDPAVEPGVEPAVDGPEALLIDVRVILRGPYIRMPQKFLNRPQVSAAVQKMGCKTVA